MNYRDLIKSNQVLAQYYHGIEKTFRPYLKISLNEHQYIDHLSSKIGGTPYCQEGFSYPKINDNALLFLAQINLADTIGFDLLPDCGILQFYIGEDDCYGLFSNEFKVVYHEKVSAPQQKNVPEVGDSEIKPFWGNPLKMKFEQAEMPITASDHRFDIDMPDDAQEEYIDTVPSYDCCHQVGGYPVFTQEDPRWNKDHQDKDFLLLQIDSDYKNKIGWGDSGVAHFFISEEDLKNKKFSNVQYNWDCY
ncbi:YwqG family protein [Piscirickettsia litoralis]|uniref:DUF1963 domain-containing protein n=1 Tax=Piscirickettsia litoralis TaxID=1891921 RepID=A0ABX2ZZH0_9GAMM|nr:YwqG family protein [Piscirickettsia litoralis]ODN41422.1 hypothetical protein BGC07_16805 [Piscirickettsia litoralis]